MRPFPMAILHSRHMAHRNQLRQHVPDSRRRQGYIRPEAEARIVVLAAVLRSSPRFATCICAIRCADSTDDTFQKIATCAHFFTDASAMAERQGARCGTTSRVWYKSKHNTQTRPLHQSKSRSVIAFLLRSMPYYGLVPFDARPYYGLISFAPAEIYGSVHALFRNFVNSHSSQTVLRFFISLAILIRQTPSTATNIYQKDHNTNQVNQRSYYRNVQCKRE